MVEEKERSAASEALIALRKAMGKTQQTFAVEVLKTSIGTIARYETNDPPRGDVLLRLRDIAKEQDLAVLAGTFESIWIEEVQAVLGSRITIFPAEGNNPARASVILSLSGEQKIKAIKDALTVGAQLDDPKLKAGAHAALAELNKTAKRGKDRIAADIEDFFFGKYR